MNECFYVIKLSDGSYLSLDSDFGTDVYSADSVLFATKWDSDKPYKTPWGELVDIYNDFDEFVKAFDCKSSKYSYEVDAHPDKIIKINLVEEEVSK